MIITPVRNLKISIMRLSGKHPRRAKAVASFPDVIFPLVSRIGGLERFENFFVIMNT